MANSLRGAASSPDIIDADQHVVDEVRQLLRAFDTLIAEADRVLAGGLTAWGSCFEDVPWKQAAAAQRKLEGELARIRAQKLQRR